MLSNAISAGTEQRDRKEKWRSRELLRLLAARGAHRQIEDTQLVRSWLMFHRRDLKRDQVCRSYTLGGDRKRR